MINDYKLIKNFLTKDEQNILSLYTQMRHTTNQKEFDEMQSNVMDTLCYGDAIMDSLLLVKQKAVEKEFGGELKPQYSFWRLYTRCAVLKEHTDRPSCEVSVTVFLGSCGTPWPIYMGNNSIELEPGDAVLYLGNKLKHKREEFLGDWHSQVFLHYVDANGPFKDLEKDGRTFWGLKRNAV